jgi:hypothetical protein
MQRWLVGHGWAYLAYVGGQALLLWTPVLSAWWGLGVALTCAGLCGIGIFLWKT